MRIHVRVRAGPSVIQRITSNRVALLVSGGRGFGVGPFIEIVAVLLMVNWQKTLTAAFHVGNDVGTQVESSFIYLPNDYRSCLISFMNKNLCIHLRVTQFVLSYEASL